MNAAVADQVPIVAIGDCRSLHTNAPVLPAAIAAGKPAGRRTGDRVAGRIHSDRHEEFFAQKLLVALSGNDLNDCGEDAVSSVRVSVTLTRGSVQLGSHRTAQKLIARNCFVVASEITGQAGSVSQKLMNGNALFVRRNVFQVFRYRIRYLKFGIRLEPDDR